MQFINVYTTTLSSKMKALYYFLFMIESTGFVACCSIENINKVVENANVSCLDNLCTAQCYRNFIFPTGLKEVSYNCKDEVWTPLLSSCKRLPAVSITYSAEWSFTEILPSKCDNISTRLDDLEEEMVEIVANTCLKLEGINAAVQFNYSFLAFTVNTNFTAVYRNYKTRNILNTCTDYTVLSIPNLPFFRTMFDNVTCTGSNSSSTIFKAYIRDKFESCLNGTEVHNVTSSETGKIEQYCDFRDILTSDTSPDMATEAFTTETWFISKNNLEIDSIIYIAAPAAGVLLISVIIIAVVCVQKRVKSLENLPAVHIKVYDQSFKGELIENELYQSADNAIDSTGNEVNSKVNINISSAAPNCKDFTQTEEELEENQYSYPSKCKERNLSVEFRNEEIDKLYSNAAVRGHKKTLNDDVESACQYAKYGNK